MPDLHTRLTAAVNARLELARAAAIRHCERDLRVLKRHAPVTTPAGIACDHCERLCHSQSGLGCDSPDAPWPCDDIEDLADAYGVEVGTDA